MPSEDASALPERSTTIIAFEPGLSIGASSGWARAWTAKTRGRATIARGARSTRGVCRRRAAPRDPRRLAGARLRRRRAGGGGQPLRGQRRRRARGARSSSAPPSAPAMRGRRRRRPRLVGAPREHAALGAQWLVHRLELAREVLERAPAPAGVAVRARGGELAEHRSAADAGARGDDYWRGDPEQQEDAARGEQPRHRQQQVPVASGETGSARARQPESEPAGPGGRSAFVIREWTRSAARRRDPTTRRAPVQPKVLRPPRGTAHLEATKPRDDVAQRSPPAVRSLRVVETTAYGAKFERTRTFDASAPETSTRRDHGVSELRVLRWSSGPDRDGRCAIHAPLGRRRSATASPATRATRSTSAPTGSARLIAASSAAGGARASA